MPECVRLRMLGVQLPLLLPWKRHGQWRQSWRVCGLVLQRPWDPVSLPALGVGVGVG